MKKRIDPQIYRFKRPIADALMLPILDKKNHAHTGARKLFHGVKFQKRPLIE